VGERAANHACANQRNLVTGHMGNSPEYRVEKDIAGGLGPYSDNFNRRKHHFARYLCNWFAIAIMST
jgi:hypothetical protein